MAWTELTRKRYERNTARYSSDVTDEEWAIVAPLLPGVNGGAILDHGSGLILLSRAA